MSFGTLVAALALLIGLTLQTGMSWNWWVAAVVIGMTANLALEATASWHARQRAKKRKAAVAKVLQK